MTETPVSLSSYLWYEENATAPSVVLSMPSLDNTRIYRTFGQYCDPTCELLEGKAGNRKSGQETLRDGKVSLATELWYQPCRVSAYGL
jgi:hypothetical protein